MRGACLLVGQEGGGGVLFREAEGSGAGGGNRGGLGER